MENSAQPLLNVLRGEALSPPPVWFMRQAGRYLPEYRATREEAGSFLDLCYAPELAAEVTLQPLRRYDMDAAILFADILLVPHAIGQEVTFVAGEGPQLSPPVTPVTLSVMQGGFKRERLKPIYETVRRVRSALSPEKTLIGFAGAPWTVATYMLAGSSQKDPSALRHHAYKDQGFIADLMDLLIEETTAYLIHQIEAGADSIKIFDSWAGGLPGDLTYSLCLEPMARITEGVKAAHPTVPVIWFPKGVGAQAIWFAQHPLCDAIAIDMMTPPQWARENLSPHAVVQGGLDPLLVVAGGERLDQAVRHLRDSFQGVPYIFNLGHGFVPETPPEHVARVMTILREMGE